MLRWSFPLKGSNYWAGLNWPWLFILWKLYCTFDFSSSEEKNYWNSLWYYANDLKYSFGSFSTHKRSFNRKWIKKSWINKRISQFLFILFPCRNSWSVNINWPFLHSWKIQAQAWQIKQDQNEAWTWTKWRTDLLCNWIRNFSWLGCKAKWKDYLNYKSDIIWKHKDKPAEWCWEKASKLWFVNIIFDSSPPRVPKKNCDSFHFFTP